MPRTRVTDTYTPPDGPALREILTRLAPGTPLRDGLDRVRRGNTGALLVLGHSPEVEALCDGGFALDVDFAPTRLRELSKMDGAVVLSTDCTRILRANVHLVPDSSLPTTESGTRHRSAERTALQTGVPVVSVSRSMNTCTVYVGSDRHVLADSSVLFARADQAISLIERHSGRTDRAVQLLDQAEIGAFATVRDVVALAQQLLRLDRLVAETGELVVEMGEDGRRTWLELEELLAGSHGRFRALVRDHLAEGVAPSSATALFSGLSDEDLLVHGTVARCLGLPSEPEDADSHVTARGYRLLARIPRLRPAQIEALVARFGSVPALLAAEQSDFADVDGVGALWARHVRTWLTRLERAAEAGS